MILIVNPAELYIQFFLSRPLNNYFLPHLGRLWFQSKSASVLYKYLYYTKVDKLCCSEIVS